MSGNHDRDTPGSAGSAGRDASVARAWQEASSEQPPARLDDAILAAARESVRQADGHAKVVHAGPKRRSSWLQWQPLLAAASVTGLAFVLVQMLPRDRAVAPTTRTQEQVQEQVQGRAEAQEPAQEQLPAAPPALGKQQATTAGPQAPAMDAAVTDPAMERAAVASGDLDTLARSAAPPPAAAAPATRQAERRGDAELPDAADRAARIAAMHAAGDEAAAADALRAFRAVEPDADDYLPDSLREWARTIE